MTTTTKRILIVDDNAATLLALSEALRTRFGDVSIDVAGSGQSALALMQHVEYDVIISDILMPEMNGIELLKTARQKWPTLVMVLMTAGDLNFEEQAMANGAFAFVAKPFEIDAFASTIKTALQRATLGEADTQLK